MAHRGGRQEAARAEQIRRDMGRPMIRQWRRNRALRGQYGGRVIFQQLGPEQLDACRRYLEERQAAGDFRIHDKALEEQFWGYFKDDSMHDFYEPGSGEEAQAFAVPPWERTAVSQEGSGCHATVPAPSITPAPPDGCLQSIWYSKTGDKK